jgi:ribose 5-phosphate isomerase B
MRVAIASDHAGYTYKQRLVALLRDWGHEVEDLGTDSTESTDYPLFIRPAAEAVAAKTADRAIVLGGSGNGEAIVANRVPGVRCALVWSEESARLARQHNEANVIAIGERLTSWETVEAMVRIWLETPFEGGRHARRIAMIDDPGRVGAG